jgi:hypothetical protein
MNNNQKNDNNVGWKGDKAGKVAVHHWVKRRKKKTGRCTSCDKKGYTEWANKDHQYQRNIDDYIELCKSCHCKLDDWPRKGGAAWNKGAKCSPGCTCGRHTRYSKMR